MLTSHLWLQQCLLTAWKLRRSRFSLSLNQCTGWWFSLQQWAPRALFCRRRAVSRQHICKSTYFTIQWKHLCAFMFHCFMCLQTAPFFLICVMCQVIHDNNGIFLAKTPFGLSKLRSQEHPRAKGGLLCSEIAHSSSHIRTQRDLLWCYLLDLVRRWKHTEQWCNKEPGIQ